MSGIYISGMEKPKNCLDCPCCGDLEVYCKLGCEINLALAAMYIAHDCPLIPVPEHGRLVDADALVTELEKFCKDNWVYNTVSHMPTIIPADKETPCEDCPYDKCSIPEIGSCEVADKDGAR